MKSPNFFVLLSFTLMNKSRSSKTTSHTTSKTRVLSSNVTKIKKFTDILMNDKQREIWTRKAKMFGNAYLLAQFKDPTLMEVSEETASVYFGPDEIGLIEAREKGGEIHYFETSQSIIYLANNGYAGMTTVKS